MAFIGGLVNWASITYGLLNISYRFIIHLSSSTHRQGLLNSYFYSGQAHRHFVNA